MESSPKSPSSPSATSVSHHGGSHHQMPETFGASAPTAMLSQPALSAPAPASAAAAAADSLNTAIDDSEFATFSRAYSLSESPDYAFQLMSYVHIFILAACRKYGASEDATLTFFKKLQAEVFKQGDMPLQELAARLWFSCTKLQVAPDRSIEFCSLVNRMLRERDPELLPSGCSVVRGINLLFRENQDPNAYPPSSQLHRGGALPLHHLPFFTAGKMFRVPMYLSTTFNEAEAFV